MLDVGLWPRRELICSLPPDALPNKRSSSPYINRFLQPDTIIPGLDNPQSWNRYSYVLNNPVNASDPTGHKCAGEADECKDEKNKPINGAGGLIPVKKEKESPEDILKKHSDKPWGELSQEQQAALLAYGCGTSCWAENQSGNVHDAEFWMDPLFYLESFVVGAGAYRAIVGFATINSEAGILSLGSNGLYQKAGFTFFQLPDLMYKALNTVGLARLVNISVVTNQIAQEKPAIVTLFNPAAPGPGTQMEMELLQAAQYIESTANWLGADKIFQPSTWQWLH